MALLFRTDLMIDDVHFSIHLPKNLYSFFIASKLGENYDHKYSLKTIFKVINYKQSINVVKFGLPVLTGILGVLLRI